jgi:hypothetical protein
VYGNDKGGRVVADSSDPVLQLCRIHTPPPPPACDNCGQEINLRALQQHHNHERMLHAEQMGPGPRYSFYPPHHQPRFVLPTDSAWQDLVVGKQGTDYDVDAASTKLGLGLARSGYMFAQSKYSYVDGQWQGYS